MKILVVDDDESTRDFVAMVLKMLGHEVVLAVDGLEGLDLFKSFQPDIVFADIQMPNMDGLEMLEILRKIDSEVLVIINSTLDSPEYTLRALRLRANDYLVKPLQTKDIAAILSKYAAVLENRTQTREVLGLIQHREVSLEIANRLDLAPKIVDRLLMEAEQGILPQDRLGIRLGLLEILVNAIEHGNLAITYDEKTAATMKCNDDLEKLVEERKCTALYKDRRVNIEFRMNRERCEWLIADQGSGFDWKNLPDPSNPENLLICHGRGIMLARLQFDECNYLDCGNKVQLVKYRS